MMDQTTSIIVAPTEGRVVHHPSGAVITIKVRSAETGGAYSLLESVLPAGGRIPPHVHHNEDEATYVLEGELSVEMGESTLRAEAGTYLVLPHDVPQGFTNPGPGPCRFLTMFMPGGNEQFFEDAAELARANDGAPPAAEMKALHRRYALEYL
jgi:quercetin dioxygenase-like cupin family protein